MPAATVQNPPALAQTGESKSAKKKKAKAALAAGRTESPAPAASPEHAGSVAGNNEASEHPYIRDLKKYVVSGLVAASLSTSVANLAEQEHP